MATVLYPTHFTSVQSLFMAIKAKYDADGISSPLKAYFAEHGIDLNVVFLSIAEALTHHTSGGLLSMQSENHKQLRDNRFDASFTVFKGEVQFLKSFYKGNSKALGEWSIVVDGRSRIVYPTLFDDKVTLMHAFNLKHEAMAMTPAGSPLATYLTANGIFPPDEMLRVNQAAESHSDYLAAADNSEIEMRQRNNLHNPVVATVHGIGDFLKKLYINNPKMLTAYGFAVVDSARAPKLQTTSLKLGERKTVSSVTIGGTFTNTGAGDLHLYKGKTTTGTPAMIPANGHMGMPKGYSTITIMNPSMDIAGKFTVLVSNN